MNDVRSTYRLQFHAGFTFRDAAAVVPYLARLGITHVYCSPYLRARAGSTHGYDIVDHRMLNPEIGTPADFDAFVAALRAHGMGHILDFVPNHMAVGGDDNPWWQDVLRWGAESHYADAFDIDWEPLRSDMRGKVLLPFLGDQYGAVLDAGDLRWTYADGEIALRYYEHRFPLHPGTYALVLDGAEPPSLRSFAPLFAALDTVADRGERRRSAASLQRLLAETEEDHVRAWIATLDDARASEEGKRSIDAVVEAQRWRPASWRVAAEEINYRRFFDVNALGALRMEHAGTFADTHGFIFTLLEEGKLDGLRLDHVDGLFDPIGYCRLLRERAQLLGQPLYLVVEKILEAGATLPERWDVDGTTGYEYMNASVGVLIERDAERALDRLYRRFTGDELPFVEVAYEAKRFVLMRMLSSELRVLALRLDRIARRDPHTRDYTLGTLTRALIETISVFPVYRTYVTAEGVNAADRAVIDEAIAEATRRDQATDPSVYGFLRRVLVAEDPAYVEFAMRFQQLTSPVAAKGVEDTAFYRSVRFVALNEVGGNPARFGTSVEDFHAENARRAAERPRAMIATSTHDDKRGEDVRARLAVLSEMPQAWGKAVARWSRRLRRLGLPIDRIDEYLLFQNAVGAWPVELLAADATPAAARAYAERLTAYVQKAGREAKRRTSWINPDARYEDGLRRAVDALLDARMPLFGEVRSFAATLAAAAVPNVLAQTVLRATAPGVPDTYRGADRWALTLVDPDNRRDVDFAANVAALDGFDAALRERDRADVAAELYRDWHDGRFKLYALRELLHARRAWPPGAYAPLAAAGAHARRVVAYARGDALVAVARTTHAVSAEGRPLGALWGDTVLLTGRASPRYRERLTGREITANDGRIALADVFATLPAAVLEPLV